MPCGTASPVQAVIICTRNRPDDLYRTLRSTAASEARSPMLVMIVDGSDKSQSRRNRRVVADLEAIDIRHLPFPETPAGTRQRNYGIDHLPSSVEVVHFVDDDVTVLPGYFDRLAQTLSRHPDVGGVGGLILDPNASNPRHRSHLFRRLFLLSSARPGRVLPSGHVSALTPSPHPFPVAWLSTCASSYRRTVFDRYRFDPAAEGASPRLEDLDFSYRVRRSWKLLAEPRARLIHTPSAVNRRSAKDFAAESLPRRYWFVEKNIRHPFRKPAFWWATFGRLLAVLTSNKPEKWAVLRGLLQGMRTVWQRAHPLLQDPK